MNHLDGLTAFKYAEIIDPKVDDIKVYNIFRGTFMIYTDDFVPVISKEDVEIKAEMFLQEYCPEALRSPMAVPIELIAEKDMGLTIDYAHLTEDLSILGMMVFTDGKVEIYKKDTDEYVYAGVKKGTILIDSDLYHNGGRARERFTVAHEVAHWVTHGLSYASLSYTDQSLSTLCRCHAKQATKLITPEDWLEWQANSIGAAILMPKVPFIVQAEALKDEYSEFADWADEDMFGEIIAGELASKFGVSKQAASIRLNTLNIAF